MSKTLVIVESPNKVKSIGAYLGSKYMVVATCGHVRGLFNDKNIDKENGFNPKYQVDPKKTKYIAAIRAAYKKCNNVILAVDADREGESIGYHIAELLKLDLATTPRIVFNKITKNELQNAIKNPITLNMNLVRAQEARAVLDLLIGYELSPILWKHVQSSLSAGRVQSVATKLVVEKEREISQHVPESYYKVDGEFKDKIYADLNKKLEKRNNALTLLKAFKEAIFTISDLSAGHRSRNPSAPYTTSTMQQDAAHKLHMGPRQAMQSAQLLFEKSYITYHRTDSVALSEETQEEVKEYIMERFSEKYYKETKYKTKVKNAQEGHGAIVPTDISKTGLTDSSLSEKDIKLYEMIWKRTVASQMAAAEYDTYTMKIAIDNVNTIENINKMYFTAKAEKLVFDGFLAIYSSVSDAIAANDDVPDDNGRNSYEMFGKLKVGDILKYQRFDAKQKYTEAKARYSESSLVKKLEDSGIGRPSTYASIINTIFSREYVKKDNVKGTEMELKNLYLECTKPIVKEVLDKVMVGAEKGKLVPTEIGKIVTEFLERNFPDIMEYKYTARVEKELDEIALGKKIWNSVVSEHYNGFHPAVENMKSMKVPERENSKNAIGKHPETGEVITHRLAKYGHIVQMGDKIKKAPAKVTLEQAIKLLEYPMIIGSIDSKDVKYDEGKYGFYLNWNGNNYSVKEDTDNMTIDRAKEIINGAPKVLREFSKGIIIMEGKYGKCFLDGKKYVPLPDSVDWQTVTEDVAKEIVSTYRKKPFTKK